MRVDNIHSHRLKVNLINESDEYCLDIFQAILSIREVEGQEFMIAVPIPNPQFEFLRFKEYPFQFPCLPLLIRKYGDINKAVSVAYKNRIYPYLKDSMIKYDIS